MAREDTVGNIYLAFADLTRALDEFMTEADSLPARSCAVCGFDDAALERVLDKVRDYNAVVAKHNLFVDRGNTSQGTMSLDGA